MDLSVSDQGLLAPGRPARETCPDVGPSHRANLSALQTIPPALAASLFFTARPSSPSHSLLFTAPPPPRAPRMTRSPTLDVSHPHRAPIRKLFCNIKQNATRGETSEQVYCNIRTRATATTQQSYYNTRCNIRKKILMQQRKITCCNSKLKLLQQQK